MKIHLVSRRRTICSRVGRLDGRVSTKASVRHHLPPPDFKPEQLNQMFASLSL